MDRGPAIGLTPNSYNSGKDNWPPGPPCINLEPYCKNKCWATERSNTGKWLFSSLMPFYSLKNNLNL